MARVRHELRSRLQTVKYGSEGFLNSGTVWPNGEFSLGSFCEYGEEYAPNEWMFTQITDDPSFRWRNAVQPECDGYFTSSDTLNSRKRSKSGLKGITGYGRKMVRSGAFLLEKKLGKDDIAFCTLTVPTLNREGRVNLAKNWGEIMHRLVEWLSRRLARSGRPTTIIGCTEVQSGRLKKYAQGYLHAHLIWPAYSNTGGRYAVDVLELREWWKKALERFSGTSLPVYPRVELVPVKKSVEAYLGKYMSKGTGDELQAFIEDLGEECVPGQWWHCSADMRQAVKNNLANGTNTGDFLDSVVQWAFGNHDFSPFEYIYHIDCPVDGLMKTVGWVGKLRPEYRNMCLALYATGDIWSPVT